MRKLFLFLLKKYSKTEEDRIKIIETLNDQVSNEYSEQSAYGNVYNSNIEYIMGNEFIRDLVYDYRTDELNMVKNNIISSTDKAFKFIKNEPRRKKLKKLKNVIKSR